MAEEELTWNGSSQAPEFAAIIACPLPGAPRLGIQLVGARLVAVDFLPPHFSRKAGSDPEARQVAGLLEAYFADPASWVSLARMPPGTPYQQRVWKAMCDVAPGETISYGALARRIGSGARAVASACRANPVPVFIPCHRVVGARDLGGYIGARGGAALGIKKWLLEHEARGVPGRG